ncbi:glycogen debranching protein GlgX [Bifidobacterium simiarum]|uniref:glycogen debranching protein GlgX n=1 Tax=Bifidobacterium simiarum TaxID=2045441 RepID=UPI001BDBD777|nr:glycogen debranching protein GlgX [Bifidobacterium simiarum]MBT1165921.1 glycogen debranching protein GlgX [Bifidobacterium simiarum]
MERTTLHRYATRPGLFLTDDGGADAVVWSETADQVWLSVIEPIDQPSAFYTTATRLPKKSSMPFDQQIDIYPICSRIIEDQYCRETLFKMEGPNYGMWYVHLPRAWDGMRYGYRAAGAWDPQRGVQFNPYKILLDPYAKGVDGTMEICPEAFSYQCTVKDGKVIGDPYGKMSELDSLGHVPLSTVIDDRDTHKHEGDPKHPHVPWSKTVIYELHVKGFTKNAPWMPEELRGTYAGLAHPTTIAYLQNLGITTVELLPIFASQTEVGIAQRGKTNYWGYSTLGYFSPNPQYATKRARELGPTAVRQEVIDMVRALHAGGIEVLLDVVYNHTCEGANDGPTVCWRGLDSVSYYRRRTDNPGTLIDTTGCGNTLDFTNTRVIEFAVDSLRYWAKRIGVDGFRFDLGVTLARLEGTFSKHHPFLYALRSDLMLGNLKLIMEPWDLGEGGWRTGQFGIPFAEWNDRFRDTARKFWLTDVDSQHHGRGNEVGLQEMATRLCGSADLYATDPGRGAVSSINFVSCHDGFTMTDLTRYSHKHNEANGEENRDGTDMNHSVNFGVEGPSDDELIERNRERAALNLFGTLLMSLGTPMILAGDEFRNTQGGNNNAYCQDNDINWLNWDWLYAKEKTPEMRRLETVTDLIAMRKSIDLYHHEDFFTLLSMLGLMKPSSRVQWILPDGSAPAEHDWFDKSVRAFAMRLLSNVDEDVMIVVNGTDDDKAFVLPDDTSWKMLWSSASLDDEGPVRFDDVNDLDEVKADVAAEAHEFDVASQGFTDEDLAFMDRLTAKARAANAGTAPDGSEGPTGSNDDPFTRHRRWIHRNDRLKSAWNVDDTAASRSGTGAQQIQTQRSAMNAASADQQTDDADVAAANEAAARRHNDPWLISELSINLFKQQR